MEPAARIARDAADQLHLRHDPIPIDEPDCRSSVHAAVRRSRRGVSVLRFSLRLGDRARAASLSSTARMPRSAPNQTLTAAFEYDGERGVLTNHRSTAAPQRPSRDNTGTTVQYEASNERVSLVGGIRFENNGSFGFYVAPRIAASWLVSSGRRRRARRHAPARQRRTRHQGAAVHPVVQPVAKLPRQSRSRSPSGRADSTSASSSVSRGNRVAIEAIYFANHFDDLISLGPFDPVTFNAQYENIGETRASGLELVGTAVAAGGLRFTRRLYVPRFEGRHAASAAARSLRRADSCTGGRVTPARCRRRTRAIA